LRAFDVCQRKGAGRYFPGTTKLIYVKPVSLVNMLLPAYPRVLLVDHYPEKSDGVGPAGNRWKNLPDEHMEVPPFRGQFMDNCLNPDGGASWVALHKRIGALDSCCSSRATAPLAISACTYLTAFLNQ